MKRFTLLMMLFAISNDSFCQVPNGESYYRTIVSNRTIDERVDAAIKLLLFFQRTEPDSSFYYAEKVIRHEQSHHNPLVRAAGYLMFAYSNFLIDEEGKLLEYTLKSSQILEDHPNELLQTYVFNFRSFLEDSVKALEWMRKAVQNHNTFRSKDPHSIILLNNTALVFFKINLDSALFYARKSYEYSQEIQDTLSEIFPVYALAEVFIEKKQFDSAKIYAQKALAIAERTNQYRDHLLAGQVMGYVFLYSFEQSQNVREFWSSVDYFKKAFKNAGKSMSAAAGYAEVLVRLYNQTDETDSLRKYIDTFLVLKNQTKEQTNALRIQSLLFDEEERLAQKEKAEKEKAEERKHNLELTIIAIGILSCLVFFLIVHRGIRVDNKVIRFLGVVILLITFEFFNLLLHPFLERILHHRPLYMLFALVVLASIISPLHHKLEHVISKKLAEKKIKIKIKKLKRQKPGSS